MFSVKTCMLHIIKYGMSNSDSSVIALISYLAEEVFFYYHYYKPGQNASILYSVQFIKFKSFTETNQDFISHSESENDNGFKKILYFTQLK